MHPGQKLKPGAQVLFERDGARLHGEVLERHFYGRRSIRLSAPTGGRDRRDRAHRSHASAALHQAGR